MVHCDVLAELLGSNKLDQHADHSETARRSSTTANTSLMECSMSELVVLF